MVTGFNTEIECEDIRYHIQTEVMPSQDAAILTLVYKAGAIIDRVKRNYREILGEAPTREEVRFLAERQHRRVIEAIQERHGMTPASPGPPPGPLSAPAPPDDPSLEHIIMEYLDSRGPSDPGANPPPSRP